MRWRAIVDEPWRQAVNLMLARLPEAEIDPAAGGTSAYTSAAELAHDLRFLRQSLIDVGATRIAHMDLDPILRVVQTFGFHLAALDIRQNSRFHELALAQLMTAAGLDGDEFLQWDEAQRLAFLNQELRSPRPFTRPDQPIGPEADAVLGAYRTVVEHMQQYGARRIGRAHRQHDAQPVGPARRLRAGARSGAGAPERRRSGLRTAGDAAL